jgi:hypothetical protein
VGLFDAGTSPDGPDIVCDREEVLFWEEGFVSRVSQGTLWLQIDHAQKARSGRQEARIALHACTVSGTSQEQVYAMLFVNFEMNFERDDAAGGKVGALRISSVRVL